MPLIVCPALVAKAENGSRDSSCCCGSPGTATHELPVGQSYTRTCYFNLLRIYFVKPAQAVESIGGLPALKNETEERDDFQYNHTLKL